MKIVVDRSVYGGMFVDKFFLHVKDSDEEEFSDEEEVIQLPEKEWDKYNRGDEYP